MRAKILLIEDDPILGESIKEFLEHEDFEVCWIQDDREFVDTSLVARFDVLVLDLVLKFKCGEDILKEVRQSGLDIPILILTAKNSITDKETCFNLGADDYLSKPFEPKELVLRLKAILRRYKLDHVIKVGSTEINLKARIVKKEGREIKLSKTAWELLELLIKNKGKVVNTNVILNCIWQDKPVGQEIVRAYIKELRKVLPKESIKTFRGVGYMFDEV